MPLYEYECLSCEHIFEKFVRQPATDKYPVCPECGKQVRKLMSSPSFKINGYSAENGYSKK